MKIRLGSAGRPSDGEGRGRLDRLLPPAPPGDEGCYPEAAGEPSDGCFPHLNSPQEGCFPASPNPRGGRASR